MRQEIDRAEEDLPLRNLREKHRQKDRRRKAERNRQRHILERAPPCLPEPRIGGDADEVVESRPARGAHNPVVLKGHDGTLHERIVAPQRHAQHGRRQKEPRKPAAAGGHLLVPRLLRTGVRPPMRRPDDSAADQEAEDENPQHHARQRTLRGDARTVGIEHQPSVRILRDGGECGLEVKLLAGIAQQNAEKPTAHDVAGRLPEPDVRLGDRLDPSRLKILVHLPDTGRHLFQIALQPQTLQIRRHAPARAPFTGVHAHLLVIDLLRRERHQRRPHLVALGLRAVRHGLRHRIEMLVRLQHGTKRRIRRRERHQPHKVRRKVEMLRKIRHQIFAAEHASDLAAREQLRHIARNGQDGQPTHKILPHETLQKRGSPQAFRRIEARLPFLFSRRTVGFQAHHIAARRPDPRQKAPRTVFDRQRPPPRLREPFAPMLELIPSRGRRFRIESRLLDEILPVHQPVIRHARSGHRIDVSVVRRHLPPKRRRMPPPLPVLVDPLVKRIGEALIDIVAQDVEPGLVDIRRAAAGQRQHELGASAATRQDQPAPLLRMDVGILLLESDERLGRGVLRVRRPIAHEERDVRRGDGRLAKKKRNHEKTSHAGDYSIKPNSPLPYL